MQWFDINLFSHLKKNPFNTNSLVKRGSERVKLKLTRMERGMRMAMERVKGKGRVKVKRKGMKEGWLNPMAGPYEIIVEI